MTPLLTLFILTVTPAAVSESTFAKAVEVFACDFEESTDVDFDKWPDRWTRRKSRDYPQYVEIEIEADPGQPLPGGKNCLQIRLDGGAAAIYSPPIPVSPLFSYMLRGHLKTNNLKHDVAYYSVTFFDKDFKPLETHYSEHYRNVADWQSINIGPLMPEQKQIRAAVIGLHLRPTKSADLIGGAMFDNIRLLRLPRMTLNINNNHNVFQKTDNIEVSCEVSGILERNPTLLLKLFDVNGRMLTSTERRLAGRRIESSNEAFSQGSGSSTGLGDTQDDGFIGQATWKLPISDFGFYRVQASIAEHAAVDLQREITLVVVQNNPRPTGREFGWSLPNGEDPLPLKPLAGLLGHVGINWVKFPVWFDKDDYEGADNLAEFAERLGDKGIEMVGVLDQPPEESIEQFGDDTRMLAASIFVEPELWRPIVEPVMTRLPLKVRWWQLGSDDDTSFVGLPDLEEKIAEIKHQLELFGQEIHLGFSWRWIYQIPDAESPPWEYLTITESTPFTHTELENYLDGYQSSNVKLWLALHPLSRSEYDLDTRIRDLVTRMLASKIKNVEGVFIPDPFNTERGVMNSDGTPGELLLPWRTTAFMLSGTQYLGSITLPQGSRNYIFSRGDKAFMVVWSNKARIETIYLGDDIQQVDVWGHNTTPKADEHRQVIEVGPLPTFITGVNKSIAMWRMQFAFENRRLSSIFGRDQSASFRIKNTFDQGVGGKIVLQTPDVWTVTPKKIPFKLPTGEELHQQFEVNLRSDASTGPQDIRVDFEITADKNYKFSVYDTMQIGLGDITVELNAHLDDDGSLVVDQHIVNTTEKFVSFDCLIFAPDRRRQRTQVTNLGQGRHTQTYIFRDGEELIGKMIWLRAEEINGPRILNYRVKVDF